MAHRGDSVPIRVYVDALLKERDKRHQQRDHYTEQAIATARGELKEKLGYLNELRSNVATKDQIESLAIRVTDIKSTLDGVAGVTTGKAKSWALMAGIVTVTAGLSIILGFVLAHVGS